MNKMFNMTNKMSDIPNSNDTRMITLARNIRRLREEKGLSLTELAEKAGISKSTLSSLEAGKTNPTISTLWAIADALGVPFGALIGSEKDMEVEEEGVSVRLIEQSEGIEVYLMRLNAKSIRKAEPHPQGVKEHVLVVKGSVLVGSLDAPKLVSAVEKITFRGDQPHVYVALEKPALLVVVVDYTGGES
ncbi:XRE family transcriptional regulator [Thermococcus barophilus]|nr:XRE family transcriptional regulator [Thermococcus barophilus]